MRNYRAATLLLALAATASAQSGIVQNAAVFEGQTVVTILAVGPFFDPAVFVPVSTTNIVAPGMLAVLSYGGPAELRFDPLAHRSLPAPVSGTLSLRPAGSTTAIPVTVTNAVSGTITFVVPSGIPAGGAELLYQIGNQPTQWTTLNVVPSSFQFYRVRSGGPAVAAIAGPARDFSNVGLSTPIQPGETLRLIGSGLGSGAVTSATIGGIAAPIAYAGPDATRLGVDDILIPIPAGVPDGCYVPVAFAYNQITLTTTISKTSDGSPCKHPWQLSLSDLKTLDSGGSLAEGVVQLNSSLSAVTANAVSRSAGTSMTLSEVAAANIAAYFSPASSPVGCVALSPAGGIYSGQLYQWEVFSPATGPPVPDLGSSFTLQNATAPITLTGSINYYSATLPPPVDGTLSSLPVAYVPGGNWTWQSSGGQNLAASSFSFNLPTSLLLNGGAPLTLIRSQDQTITWNGAAFEAGATINLSLATNTASPIWCTGPAAAGSMTIPASFLSGFAANSLGTLSATVSESGPYMPHTEFQMQTGGSLLMVVSYSTGDSRPIVFQ